MLDKCLYLQQITDDYWYCDHKYQEREHPICDDCPDRMTRRMIREGRKSK